MPIENYDHSFAMTSSTTTMMASCLAVFVPETINSRTFRDVVDRCQVILNSLGDFNHSVFGNEPWQRIVYLGSGGLLDAVRESSLKVLELTADKLAAFYDSPTGFHHGPESLVSGVYLQPTLYTTRQCNLDLLAELRHDRQAMCVVAISSENDAVIETGPHILLPPSRQFIDMELAFCFLMYAQIFALTQSISVSNIQIPLPPAAQSNRVVQGVVIHP